MSGDSRGRTEVVPEVVFLGKLVERIAAGKIRVPRFQRAFVWKQTDLHALLDSVLRGFPIGSILVWDTEETIETTGRVGPVEVDPRPAGLVGYLLDGQQRVSTLVGTLRLPYGAESIVDQVDWCVYCDLDNQEFLRTPVGGVKPQHFPVRSLLNTAGFFTACRHIESEVDNRNLVQRWLDEADRLASAFRDYQLPLIHIREADLDSAVTVFARLNRTGRKMTADEMVSALTYREGQFHLARKLDEFKDELEELEFGNLDRVLLLRAVLAALDRDIYAKDWADLMVKKEVRARLPEVFESAAGGIVDALEFLEDLGVTSDRLLPYGLQLVLLGEFFRLCPRPADEVVRAAEPLVLGDVIYRLVRRSQHRTSYTRIERDPQPCQGHGNRIQRRRSRRTGSAVSRALRWSKRPRTCLSALPGIASASFASRCGESRSWSTARNSWDQGGGLRFFQPRATRGDVFSSPANRMFVDADQYGQNMRRSRTWLA